jgi:hypothetical protein
MDLEFIADEFGFEAEPVRLPDEVLRVARTMPRNVALSPGGGFGRAVVNDELAAGGRRAELTDADIAACVTKAMREEEEAPLAFALRKTEPSEDDILPRELAKIHKPGNRKRVAIASWMRSQFALGKTATELVEHAQRHDPAMALLISELAQELEAA